MNHGIQIVQNVRKCIKWESIGIWYIHVFQSGHKQSIDIQNHLMDLGEHLNLMELIIEDFMQQNLL